MSINNLATSGQTSDLDWQTFAAAVASDDGRAAREHLAAGRSIYSVDRSTPRGLLIKTHPDGRRELVRFCGDAGDEVVASLT